MNPHQSFAMNLLCNLQHLETPPAFYNIQKLKLSLKMDISKTDWINTWYFIGKTINFTFYTVNLSDLISPLSLDKF